jgi:hypothetical protein
MLEAKKLWNTTEKNISAAIGRSKKAGLEKL